MAITIISSMSVKPDSLRGRLWVVFIITYLDMLKRRDSTAVPKKPHASLLTCRFYYTKQAESFRQRPVSPVSAAMALPLDACKSRLAEMPTIAAVMTAGRTRRKRSSYRTSQTCRASGGQSGYW